MGNKELRVIAAELVNVVRSSASVDLWRNRSTMMLADYEAFRSSGAGPPTEMWLQVLQS